MRLMREHGLTAAALHDHQPNHSGSPKPASPPPTGPNPSPPSPATFGGIRTRWIVRLGNFGCYYELASSLGLIFDPGNMGQLSLRGNPMSTVYPLELQRKIDRRWFHRSEETAPLRRPPNRLTEFSRESA